MSEENRTEEEMVPASDELQETLNRGWDLCFGAQRAMQLESFNSNIGIMVLVTIFREMMASLEPQAKAYFVERQAADLLGRHGDDAPSEEEIRENLESFLGSIKDWAAEGLAEHPIYMITPEDFKPVTDIIPNNGEIH